MPNDWNWLFNFCLSGPPKGIERKLWKFCPSKMGEPFVSYAIAAEILQMGAEAIRKKASKLPPQYRHPSVSGLIKLTGLEEITEAVNGGDQ